MKKNKTNKKEIGNIGEIEAINYLKNLGYIILDHNFYTKSGEIDIIAKDKKEYVFFEVKCRQTNKFGKPIDAINKRKEKHILFASRYYIYKHGLEKNLIRFDAIEVYIKGKNRYVNHIKNVFF